jgi:hypothetical protein
MELITVNKYQTDMSQNIIFITKKIFTSVSLQIICILVNETDLMESLEAGGTSFLKVSSQE